MLTSGGDAPGMNAAIRSVVRTAVYEGMEVTGVRRGFEGLLGADITDLKARDVSDILQRGGTMLLTARSEDMRTPEGQERAAQICKILGFEALIIIGGDGSLRGGLALSELGINVIGIPGTIDLDLPASEYTIGFDTAVTTAMEAISRIRDTSSSHERCSVVEVMGRHAGYIALHCGLTGGAEEVLIPEKPEIDTDSVIKQIVENRSKGKTHNLVVVAEGVGNSQTLAAKIQETTGIETRATILGHLQRGGSPTAIDRLHASMMGYMAVKEIINGERNKVIIMKNNKYGAVDIREALEAKREYDDTLYELIKILAI